ncbi:MAG TPA: hypothetical protein VM241_08015 [Candidatus Thermoplasmatota archaeon]|nr:hypothetical protein [Candidatus Thermoplasmatota archaeon]
MSLRALLACSLAAAAVLAVPAAVATQEPCLPGLRAYTDGDGSITLSWPPVANATAYQVMERPEGGDFTPLSPQAPAGASSFTYVPQVAADSYTFVVVALHGGSNPIATFCEAVVARIPFFPTWTGAVAGLGGALAGVSFLLRRRPT